MQKRKNGILLHITSLPGAEGIGTLGKEAYAFVDFLQESGQKLWQILPLGPVGPGNSPYQCYSAFAGEPLLIDLETLLNEGLLSCEDFDNIPRFLKSKVDFKKVSIWKQALLKKAFQQFYNFKFDEYRNEYNHFLNEHGWWLNDYALFISVRGYFGGLHWKEWDRGIKFRELAVVHEYSERLKQQINFEKFLQFMFFRQWHRLKQYANEREIQIVGDVPLYVSGDSA
ncbi:MAG TPA: 4-alpha-glucanotransferase, partial [Draconibacterium sp.]|nr:4-alpha-glucanotransferase [Draconibacterium sp.]